MGSSYQPGPVGANVPVSHDGNLPGQSAIIELLRLHDGAPRRSAVARLFGVAPLCAERKIWYDAALSEIEVGDALARLGPAWTVLHALPVGAGTSDIDHVAIGPGGVFIVNTKNHTGQTVWASQRAFLVSGIRHPHIRNMEYEMGRAERLIGSAAGMPVEVVGVLAIVAAKSITVREKHRDVTVLATGELVDWLVARPHVLAAAEVEAISTAAIRGTTWHYDAERVDDRADLYARFDEVHDEVRKAARRQIVWAAAMTIVGAGGFVLVTYSILLGAIAALARP
jgi:hypothetical protein